MTKTHFNEGMAAELPSQAADATSNICSLKSREWLDSAQAAEFLGISVNTLMNMTSSRAVPYYKLGKRNRYLREELHQMLLASKRKGA